MSWLKDYKHSLKNIHVEEWLDIYFYRPQAYLLVRLFFKTDLTPNDYSLMALFCGFVSAYFFLTSETFFIAAIFFHIFAVLDCADGMVARLKKNGTEFGRLVDGVVDYLVNVAVFIALAFCASRSEALSMSAPWYLVILAGVSKALHSGTFDKNMMEYMAYEKGEVGFIEKELNELKEKLVKTEPSNWKRKLALKIYILYTQAQMGSTPKKLQFDSNDYCQKNKLNLRLWGLIGPTAHLFVMSISIMFFHVRFYLIYAIVLANILLVVMTLIQRRTLAKLSVQASVGKQ